MSRLLVLVVLSSVAAGCDAGAKSTPPPAPVPPPPVITPMAPVPPGPPPVAPPAPVAVTPVAGEHVLLASIKRGACYGTCPIYTLTVYRDGKVEYDGEEYVKKKGKVVGTVTPEQLAALDRLFTDDHYLAYKDSYESYDVTDMPSATTSYRPLGAATTKTVGHYYGDGHAPESLTKLEDQFDAIVKSERWIGTRAERDKIQR